MRFALRPLNSPGPGFTWLRAWFSQTTPESPGIQPQKTFAWSSWSLPDWPYFSDQLGRTRQSFFQWSPNPAPWHTSLTKGSTELVWPCCGSREGKYWFSDRTFLIVPGLYRDYRLYWWQRSQGCCPPPRIRPFLLAAGWSGSFPGSWNHSWS